MNSLALLIGTIAVTFVFGWFMVSALDIMAMPVATWAASLHRFVKGERDEKDAWLFTLLVGVTRWPVIVLATVAFALTLFNMQFSHELLGLAKGLAVSTFWIIFVMRMLAIFVGSLFFGPSIIGILKSVRG